jgi:hypothetical protein
MKSLIPASAAIVVLSCAASVAHAALLAPGATLFPATAVAPVTAPLVTSQTQPFSVAGHFAGSVTVSVYQETAAANSLLGLTFVYNVTSSASSSNAIERVTTNDYAGWLVDAGYDATSGGTAPTYISRDTPGDVPGFGWFSPSGIAPGTNSPTLILRTNATAYSTDSVAIIDGATANVPELLGPVPSGGVPEPASLAVLGLGALAMLRRRR